MGASGSVVQCDQLSKEDIANFVESLGAAYRPYKEAILENGISGVCLSECQTDSDITSLLGDLGVEKQLHLRVLKAHLSKLTQQSTINASTKVPPSDAQNWTPPKIEVGECVTCTPRSIMTRLFEIQGIAMDPTDIEPAVTKANLHSFFFTISS